MTKGLPLLALALLLGGCASLSADGGLDRVSALTRERIGQPAQRQPAAPQDIRRLLSTPLDADGAVELALKNNPGLQAGLAELGVAEADMVQAGRLRNPGFSFSRMRGGDNVEIERGVLFDLGALLTMPLRSGIQQRRYGQAQLQAAARVVELAADTRRAWFNAVAAQQTVAYMEQVRMSAEAGAQLAQRMAAVGNWSRLDQSRQQLFYADAIAQLARARHQHTAARERLTRLLGLSGDEPGYSLPERLPALPAAPRALNDAEALALRQRLDIQVARLDVDATAGALGLTRATRFVNVLDAGYLNKSMTGEPRENGYEVSLELPLFDWGGARAAKAEALAQQAVQRAAGLANEARSQVRENYSAYRTAHDLARHYRDEVVPLRKRVSEEVLLRYNGMLASVFELLADAREQAASVNAAINAQRDFWIADTDLQAAINGAGAFAVLPAPGAESAGAAPSH